MFAGNIDAVAVVGDDAGIVHAFVEEKALAFSPKFALIFVLSLVTAVIYLMNGKLDFGTAWEYIPYGLIGAILGSFLLGKIPDRLIRIIFGLLMIASGVRMIL